MRLTVLLSCMHQKDSSILQKSNIQCDAVIINQCDRNEVEDFDFINEFGEKRHCRFISTTERGLSHSRNMAIENAPVDAICMLCDDDEQIESDAEKKILATYAKFPKCSLAAFSLIRKDCSRKYPCKSYKIGWINALKINSLQITFRKADIDRASIRFDEKMGSGTGNGGGEENKFVLDCLRAKLRVEYFPITIATVLPGDSRWYNGHNEECLYNSGWVARRILGSLLGMAYLFYSSVHLRSLYRQAGVTFPSALKSLLKGYFSRR